MKKTIQLQKEYIYIGWGTTDGRVKNHYIIVKYNPISDVWVSYRSFEGKNSFKFTMQFLFGNKLIENIGFRELYIFAECGGQYENN